MEVLRLKGARRSREAQSCPQQQQPGACRLSEAVGGILAASGHCTCHFIKTKPAIPLSCCRDCTWACPPPTPLEADVPCSGLRKGGLLHRHPRQHATKIRCQGPVAGPPLPHSALSHIQHRHGTCPPSSPSQKQQQHQQRKRRPRAPLPHSLSLTLIPLSLSPFSFPFSFSLFPQAESSDRLAGRLVRLHVRSFVDLRSRPPRPLLSAWCLSLHPKVPASQPAALRARPRPASPACN